MQSPNRSFGPILADTARPMLDKAREAELVLAAQEGDREAQLALVAAHLRLVSSVARRITPTPTEDTLAEGIVGLLEAIQRFEVSRGFRLSTYAAHWIRARVQRFILANRGIVGAPDTRASRRVFGRIGRAQRALAVRTSEPSAEDIASEIGVTSADVEGVLVAIRGRDVPLDTQAPDGVELPEVGSDPENRVADAELAAARRRVIDRTLALLPARERRVVEARSLAEEAVTLDQLAASLALSRERVRQLEMRALRRIGAALAVEGLAA
jgi:RNA polymerase sigma-32 factor